MDRVGRKPLLYWGVGGMILSLFLLAFGFHNQAQLGSSLGIIATTCLMVYITCFAFSMGPIAWIIVAEVFPLRLRGVEWLRPRLAPELPTPLFRLLFSRSSERWGILPPPCMLSVVLPADPSFLCAS